MLEIEGKTHCQACLYVARNHNFTYFLWVGNQTRRSKGTKSGQLPFPKPLDPHYVLQSSISTDFIMFFSRLICSLRARTRLAFVFIIFSVASESTVLRQIRVNTIHFIPILLKQYQAGIKTCFQQLLPPCR